MNAICFWRAHPRETTLIFSCMWATRKHARPAVTSECSPSVYFSSLCEINKFSSLETRESDPQSQAQKLAAADTAGNRAKLPLHP